MCFISSIVVYTVASPYICCTICIYIYIKHMHSFVCYSYHVSKERQLRSAGHQTETCLMFEHSPKKRIIVGAQACWDYPGPISGEFHHLPHRPEGHRLHIEETFRGPGS